MKIYPAVKEQVETAREVERRKDEQGSAIVIAILIMGLLSVFVAIALARTTTETNIMSNDAAEARTFYAAQGSIELMSRNFNKIFDLRLSPIPADITNVRNQTPTTRGFTGYTFDQNLQRISAVDENVTLGGGSFEGMTALRDAWLITTTATETTTGVQVQLRRTFLNNRVPIFQFGIFYDDDLEIGSGPRFDFGGRVHTNGNFFIRGGGPTYFNSRVSAAGEIVTDVSRNGYANTSDAAYANAGFGENMYIQNGVGTYVQLRIGEGSVLNGPDVLSSNADMPDGSYNPLWRSSSANSRLDAKLINDKFDGNLIAAAKRLELPLKITDQAPNIELIKPSRSTDSQVVSLSRYHNLPGIRVTLADKQNRLPANDNGTFGGKRLDGNKNGDGGGGNDKGYEPEEMNDDYTSARFNAYRVYNGTSYDGAERETWIKVQIVRVDAATLVISTTDITEDFLSLGFTERAPRLGSDFEIEDDYYDDGTDSRSIIKLQRYVIPGPRINRAGVTNVGGTTPAYTFINNGGGYSCVTSSNYTLSNELSRHGRDAKVNVNDVKVVPFPIEMFDSREGLPKELSPVTVADLETSTVSWNGVMSLVDIDVANLRRFLKGDWNGQFPNGLRNTDIPRDRGWIMYVSDRRGDMDNDGEFDMEDVYGPNDGSLQPGEDANSNGTLEADYDWEGTKYYADVTHVLASTVLPGYKTATTPADLAAVFDHRFFRRGVRLINGAQLPGDQNNGFTLASENGVYIKGDYNATGIASVGSPTPAGDYRPIAVVSTATPPIADNTQVPASVVADAVTILSNAWTDGGSFHNVTYSRKYDPSVYPGRLATETTVRAALLTGDTIASLKATPHQDGFYSERNNGAVNNFKRFLEDWNPGGAGSVRFNYCGSLINLFNSRNSTGTFKYGRGRVYNAPARNWVFDTSFLDATRLPPGTPFFQFLQVTGFQRMNG